MAVYRNIFIAINILIVILASTILILTFISSKGESAISSYIVKKEYEIDPVSEALKLTRKSFYQVYGAGDWIELGLNYTKAGSVVITLSAYLLDPKDAHYKRILDGLIEYCRNWTEINSEGNETYKPIKILSMIDCRASIDDIQKYMDSGRLVLLVVETFVYNGGDNPITFFGPGPICGYSLYLEYVFRNSSVFIHQIYKPIGDFSYQLQDGDLVLGIGGICELALILHNVGPGTYQRHLYSFILVKPFTMNLKFTAEYGHIFEIEGNLSTTLTISF